MSHKKRDGLESRVMRFILPKDEFGEYVPFCNFKHHPGVVLRIFVCEQRQCNHYRKYYIGGVGHVDDPRPGDCHDRQGNNY